MGSRSMGLGYASATLQDEWSVMNNIGGLSGVKKASASAAFHSYPAFKPFNRSAFLIVTPVKTGVLGFGLYRFGDKIYNEQVVSVGYGNQFGLASLGAKINLLQYAAEGFGTVTVVTFNFGGIANLSEKIQVGAYITNINRPQISSTADEYVPTRMILGFAFKPLQSIIAAAEVEHDLDHTPHYKGGFEYQFHKKFSARTGFNINPDAAYLGLGFNPRRFGIDYAMQYHLSIGFSHQMTLNYKLKLR